MKRGTQSACTIALFKDHQRALDGNLEKGVILWNESCIGLLSHQRVQSQQKRFPQEAPNGSNAGPSQHPRDPKTAKTSGETEACTEMISNKHSHLSLPFLSLSQLIRISKQSFKVKEGGVQAGLREKGHGSTFIELAC